MSGGFFDLDIEGITAKLEEVSLIMEEYRQDMIDLNFMLTNSNITQFIVISSPNLLAVEETKKLINALKNSNVTVNSVIVNKVLGSDERADHLVLQMRRRESLYYLSILSISFFLFIFISFLFVSSLYILLFSPLFLHV